MRIGILTLPFNNNYGGFLQCFALAYSLRKLGHQTEVIYRRSNKPSFFRTFKSFVKHIFTFGKHRIYTLKKFEDRFKANGKNVHNVIFPLIGNFSEPIFSKEGFNKLVNKYDVIVVGSDQVWKPDYTPAIENYYLDFARDWNVKKIAYSASFGSLDVKYSETQRIQCSKLIKLFDFVSVREASTLPLLETLFSYPNNKAVAVLDPTFLLTAEDYRSIFSLKKQRRNELFSYVLDNNDETTEMIRAIAKARNLRVRSIDIYKYPIPSIEEWLDCIANSELVFTDSFHGTVFSIIFDTPFKCIGNYKRGNVRMEDLLKSFSLEPNLDGIIEPAYACNKSMVINNNLLDFKNLFK